MSTLTLGATVETARVPELPAYTVYGALSVGDSVPVHMAAYNKLVRAPLVDLRTWILTGGGISHPPVISGNAMIVKVSALEAGTKIFSIPSIAGKDFLLRRAGVGALDPLLDYEVLDAGGFKLLRADDFLTLDEQFEIQFYASTPSTGGVTPSSGTGGSLFTDVLPVTANKTLGPDDIGKLVQIRAGSTGITVTLPAVETIPDHSLIMIETLITNSKQHTIQTSGGQFIYYSNTTHIKTYMGVGEILWLVREDDGYYMLPSKGNFELDGNVNYSYKVGLNELLCNGALVARAEYPRLWEYAQTLGLSLVTDAEWLSVDGAGNQPYRGCFSLGNGTTTFRLPNHMKMTMRALLAETGTDAERTYNHPGGYQADSNRSHDHPSGTEATAAGGDYDNAASHTVQSWNTGSLTPTRTSSTGPSGGVETRGENIGMLPKIKC